jgi:HlyD family secretion protein
VDAYPKDVFRGQVAQIRLNARTNQQVVVYTVVVVTDNSDLKLPPYLTANMQFEADHCHDVLRVPNGALRWKPRPQQVHPDVREAVAPTLSGKQGGRADRGGEKSPGEASTSRGGKDRGERGRLWVADGQFVRPVDVEVGLTDGTLTEVSGGDLREDMDVVLGAAPRLRGRPKS